MTKRTDGIVAEALAKSKALVAGIPENRPTHRAQAERIVAVCEALVRARPAVDPRTPNVSDRGKTLYADFPAPQSLLNRHGHLLRIWRDAYNKLIAASAPRAVDSGDPWTVQDDEMAALDHGTRAKITIMAAAIREMRRQLNMANRIIEERLPAPEHGDDPRDASVLTPAAHRILQAWLKSIPGADGKLALDIEGVRTSSKARPGTIVIPISVLQVIRSVVAVKGARSD